VVSNVKTQAIDAAKLQRLGLLTTGLVGLQLILGSVLRHLGGQVFLVLHLVVAVLIVVHVALVARRVFISCSERHELVRPVEFLAGLVLTQLMLGAGAWGTSSGFGPDAIIRPTPAQVVFATSHVAVGAAILATCVWFTMQAFRSLVSVVQNHPTGSGRQAVRQQGSVRPSVSALESRELWTSEGIA
jgi:hypothetical protein